MTGIIVLSQYQRLVLQPPIEFDHDVGVISVDKRQSGVVVRVNCSFTTTHDEVQSYVHRMKGGK